MPSEAFRRHFRHRNSKEKEPKPSFLRKIENQKKKPKIRHSRAGGNPIRPVSVFFFEFQVTSKPPFPRKTENQKRNLKSVIPVKTGIQSVRFPFFFEFQVTSKPSFPQKRESRNSKLQEFIKND
ncbi:TPA: hypothetical protein ACFM8G_001640 [Neisseria meningitidis]|uniref:hypothetical protein n=1 Tax=Neisseria meningitidis TaxID=487 RepID=UPI0003097233|nr:hypothetical protein [Neisseria meningitidis]MCF6415012.1 hypothetical protein [Neisseria meningitidis]